jgi:hypothetical protein
MDRTKFQMFQQYTIAYYTSSVSVELHTTVMMDMTRLMDPNNALVISPHDMDANVLGQLFKREIRRLSD